MAAGSSVSTHAQSTQFAADISIRVWIMPRTRNFTIADAGGSFLLSVPSVLTRDLLCGPIMHHLIKIQDKLETHGWVIVLEQVSRPVFQRGGASMSARSWLDQTAPNIESTSAYHRCCTGMFYTSDILLHFETRVRLESKATGSKIEEEFWSFSLF